MSKRKNKAPKGQEWRHVENKKLVYTVYFVLRLSVVLMLVAQFFNRNYENVSLCVLTLILFMLPSAFERRLHIDLPDTLEIIILLFNFYFTFKNSCGRPCHIHQVRLSVPLNLQRTT